MSNQMADDGVAIDPTVVEIVNHMVSFTESATVAAMSGLHPEWTALVAFSKKPGSPVSAKLLDVIEPSTSSTCSSMPPAAAPAALVARPPVVDAGGGANTPTRRTGLRVRNTNVVEVTSSPAKRSSKRKIGEVVADLSGPSVATGADENKENRAGTPTKKPRSSRKQEKPAKAAPAAEVDTNNNNKIVVPAPAQPAPAQSAFNQTEYEVSVFLAQMQAAKAQTSSEPSDAQPGLHMTCQTDCPSATTTTMIASTVPEWTQRPHTIILPPGAPSGSLHMACYTDDDQPAWAVAEPVPHPLGQFTTTTTTTTIGHLTTAYDYQRMYESANASSAAGAFVATSSDATTPHEPLNVNRMQPGTEFSYGTVFDVYTDECGLTVCHAIEKPIQPIQPVQPVQPQLAQATSLTQEAETSLKADLVDVSEEEDDNEDDKENGGNLSINSPVPANQPNQANYIYNGQDLVALTGNTLLTYATNVAKVIFTRDELMNGLLPDEKNKIRSKKKVVLDNQRIEILKWVICLKYKITLDKLPWKTLRPNLNVRFGAIGHKRSASAAKTAQA